MNGEKGVEKLKKLQFGNHMPKDIQKNNEKGVE